MQRKQNRRNGGGNRRLPPSLAGSECSPTLGEEVTKIPDMTKYPERYGDYCLNLVLLAQRRYDKGYNFNESAAKDMAEMIGLPGTNLSLAGHALVPENTANQSKTLLIEKEINKLRDRARKRHAESMQGGNLGIREGLVFIDMLNNMERLDDLSLRMVKISSEFTSQSSAR